MGVYVKGMDKIPEDGAVLVVKHDDNGKAYIKYTCTYGYSMELINVPEPHGRLIEFIDVVFKDEDAGTEEVKFGDVMRAYYEMRNAPAVIEAEGE